MLAVFMLDESVLVVFMLAESVLVVVYASYVYAS